MKLLKRIAIGAGILLGLFLLALFIITLFFEKSVGNRVVREVNKSLKTELSVRDFDLAIFESFPNASIVLYDIEIPDALDGSSLLEAEELSFRFGLFSIFGSALRLRSLKASNGALYIHTDSRGRVNYDIVAGEGDTEGSSSDTRIDIDRAELDNIELIYEDEFTKQTVSAILDEARFSGQFSSTRYQLESYAQLRTRFADLGDLRLLTGTEIGYDAKLDIDTEQGRYRIEDFYFTVEGNTLQVQGEVLQQEQATIYDLTLRGQDFGLKSLLALLPREQLGAFADFDTRGNFEFTAIVSGESSATRTPSIQASLGMQRGRLDHPLLNGSFKDVTFSASFDNQNGNNARAIFEMPDFTGRLQGESIGGSLKVTNLEAPDITLAIDGTLALEGIYTAVGAEDADGSVTFDQLSVSGKLSDMIDPARAYRVRTGGAMRFEEAELELNGQPLTVESGRIDLTNNRLTMEQLLLSTSESDALLDGYADNYLPVLLADSINSQQAQLTFDGTLVSRRLDFNELLTFIPELPEAQDEATLAEAQAARGVAREQFTNYLKGRFKAEVEDIAYERTDAHDFDGELRFDNSLMYVKGDVEVMGGAIDMDGVMHFTQSPRLEARFTLNGVDGDQLFYQMENFGQETLTNEHLSGELSGRMAVFIYFLPDGSIDLDRLRVLADATITDGRLVDFELMESFSAVVKLKDLRDIRFAKAQNYLEISNQTVYIPVMFIQSNALNLTMSGEHTFDQDMNYGIKVNAGQVLMDKFKRYNPDKDPRPAKRRGWFNLYYHVSGNLYTDYDYERSKRTVQRDFERSERRRDDIRRELERYFGVDLEAIVEPVDAEDAD